MSGAKSRGTLSLRFSDAAATPCVCPSVTLGSRYSEVRLYVAADRNLCHAKYETTMKRIPIATDEKTITKGKSVWDFSRRNENEFFVGCVLE